MALGKNLLKIIASISISWSTSTSIAFVQTHPKVFFFKIQNVYRRKLTEDQFCCCELQWQAKGKVLIMEQWTEIEEKLVEKENYFWSINCFCTLEFLIHQFTIYNSAKPNWWVAKTKVLIFHKSWNLLSFSIIVFPIFTNDLISSTTSYFQYLCLFFNCKFIFTLTAGYVKIQK